jgi:hypothetical protein
MKPLLLSVLSCLVISGCGFARRVSGNPVEEAGKCELVQALLHEPLPARYVAELTEEIPSAPAPVLVFVSRPEQGMLERLFVGEPSCGDDTFQVEQEGLSESGVFFLRPVVGGYAFDVQRLGPDELSLGGAPKGMVRHEGGSWVTRSL